MRAPPPDADLGPRIVLTDRHWLAPGALGVFVLALMASCGLTMLHRVLALSIYLAPLTFLWWTRTQRRDAHVRLIKGALSVGDAIAIPLGHIDAGYTTQDGEDLKVVLALRGRTLLRLSARDDADARGVLQALGFDASQVRTRFRHRRIFSQLVGGAFASLFGVWVAVLCAPLVNGRVLPEAAGTALLLAVWAVATAALFRLVVPRLDLSVGRDGFETRHGLRARFVPWDEVEDVREVGHGLKLRRVGKPTLWIWCNPDDGWVRAAVCARMNEALRAHAERSARGATLSLLDRGGRTFAEWRASLASLGAPTGDYRSQSVDAGRLESVLLDPRALMEHRLAAAMALTSSEPGRTRVRVVAATSADSLERTALEEIAAGDESSAAVEAALRARA
jgi:hypothetical protein